MASILDSLNSALTSVIGPASLGSDLGQWVGYQVRNILNSKEKTNPYLMPGDEGYVYPETDYPEGYNPSDTITPPVSQKELPPIKDGGYVDAGPLANVKSVPEYVEGQAASQVSNQSEVPAVDQAGGSNASVMQKIANSLYAPFAYMAGAADSGEYTANNTYSPLVGAVGGLASLLGPGGPWERAYDTSSSWGNALEKYHAAQDAARQRQVAEMNAITARMNAMRAKNQIGTFGKVYNDALAAGASQEEAYALAERAITKPLVDMSAQQQNKRIEAMDTLLVDQLKDVQSKAAASREAKAYADRFIKGMESRPGFLNYSGRFLAETGYNIGKALGLTSDETDLLKQDLDKLGASIKGLSREQVIGPGPVSNAEQAILQLVVPGMDKTPAQNLMAARWVSYSSDLQNRIASEYSKLLQSGASYSDIQKQIGAMWDTGVEQFYNENLQPIYGDAENVVKGKANMNASTGRNLGNTVNVRGSSYRLGEDGNYHLVKGE
jgi:hypothetical protein